MVRLALLAACFAGAAGAQAPAKAQGFDEQFKAAQQLVREGKRDEALAAYTAMLARSPNNSDVLLARGRLLSWMDRDAEAERDLTAATRAAPKYADTWTALGDLYRWTDRPALAADAYAHWIELAPKDPAPHLARGRVLQQAGDTSGARAEFEAARSLGAAQADLDKAMATLLPSSLAPDVASAGGYDWSATLAGSKTWVSANGNSDYWDKGLTLRRHFNWGSIGVEGLGLHRYDQNDTAYALDAYVDLWNRAYANLRYQVSSDSVGLYPKNSGRVELYQGVGKGWELAASDDWLNFGGGLVNIYGVAVAKYIGNWYGRARMTYVDSSESYGWRLTLRNYYAGDADHYLELTGSASRGYYESGHSAFITSSQEWGESASVAWVTFFNPRWGMKLGASYSDSDHTEDSISASLYTRW